MRRPLPRALRAALTLLALAPLAAACADDDVAPGPASPTADAAASDAAGADATGALDISAGAEVASDLGADDVAVDVGPPCPAPSGQRPSRRSEHAGVYDPASDRLVLFGGSFAVSIQCNFPTPTFESETWIYDGRCDQWRAITGPNPGGRVRHMAALDSARGEMLVFGGRSRVGGSGAYTLYDDLWAFDLATETWREVATTGPRPAARVNGALVYDPTGDRLVLFGGNNATSGAFYAPLSDVWIFSLAEGTWTKLTVNPGPSKRLFMGATWDDTRQWMVIYAGGDERAFDFNNPAYFDDLWALDLSGATPQWWWLDQTSTLKPVARFWSSLAYDPIRDGYLMFGGHDLGSTPPDVGNRNDLWFFDAAKQQWGVDRLGDTWNAGATGFCAFPPDFTDVDAEAPERRSAHVLAAGPDRLFVTGGKTDCGATDDLFRLDLETLTWTELTGATVGEVCLRRGGVDCNDMCF